jgi:hypothetical protein
MEPLYTLPEIARLTGIPLEELEQYEREFGDLLPPPHVGSVTCPVAVPTPPAAGDRRASRHRRRWGRWAACRSWWGLWWLAVSRVRWWPAVALGARLVLWWRRWRERFQPA